jgi:hypothetical protein
MKEQLVSNDFYEISTDSEKNRMYLTISGYWKTLLEVKGYLRDIRTAVAELSPEFTIVTDLTRAKTPPEETSDLHVKAQEYLVKAGLARTAEIHPESTVLKMAVNRYSRESGMAQRGVCLYSRSGSVVG